MGQTDIPLGETNMYTAEFFRTKLGQASLASIAAVTAMIAMTGQISTMAQDVNVTQPGGNLPIMVELA